MMNIDIEKEILIVSPFFKPFAGIGANRMDSLVDYLCIHDMYKITVLKNSDRSYTQKIKGFKDERLIDKVEVDSVTSFLDGVCKYKKALKKILLEKNFDVVLISVGPYYTLPLVRLVKKIKSDCKIILDFRDFWAHEPIIKSKSVKESIKESIKDYIFERIAIKKSDCITVTGDGDVNLLCDFYGSKVRKKTHVIYNGYDERCLNTIDKIESKKIDEKEINICVFGKFTEYLNSDQTELLSSALKNLKHKVRIIQIGNRESILSEIADSADVIYENTGYMDYSKGISYMKQYGDIFLVSSDLYIGYGTKVFDYILLNKPIIFWGSNESSLADFIKKFKYGFSCQSIESFVTAINEIYENKIEYLDSNVDIYKYSRYIQNTKFEKLIRKGLED